MLCWSLFGLCIASCSADKPVPKALCARVGQRIGEQPFRGVIYGDVGHKAYVKACPGVKLSFAFIGPEPTDYRTLEQLADKREDVLGFSALADGYIVTDGSGEYSLLLLTLSDIREDPSVAKATRAATAFHPRQALARS